jgi:hypothetical protein
LRHGYFVIMIYTLRLFSVICLIKNINKSLKYDDVNHASVVKVLRAIQEAHVGNYSGKKNPIAILSDV